MTTRPPKKTAIERLTRALDEVAELKKISRSSPQFGRWHRNARVAITNSFGEKSKSLEDFEGVTFRPSAWISGMPDSVAQAAYFGGLDRAASLLESMIDEVEEYWSEYSDQSGTFDERLPPPTLTRKVFVIHGQDKAALNEVARTLEALELEPVILHEQASEGRTIIEKFEDYFGRRICRSRADAR